MKVMTNKTEACGLQSRTEVRQTVAQMAAPNFKDSAPEDSPGQVMIFPRANSYFAPCKLGLCSVQTRTLLRAKSRFASGKLLARRAAMLLILMIGIVGSAWGQTVFENSIKLSSDQKSLTINLKNYINSDVLSKLGISSVDDLKAGCYIRWTVENYKEGSSNYYNLNRSTSANTIQAWLRCNDPENNGYPYETNTWFLPEGIKQASIFSSVKYINSGDFASKFDNKITQLLLDSKNDGSTTLADHVNNSDFNRLVCYLTNEEGGITNWSMGSGEPTIKVKLIFNLIAPDPFLNEVAATGATEKSANAKMNAANSYSDTEQSILPTSVNNWPLLTNVRYVRWYVKKNGEALDNSSDLLTLSDYTKDDAHKARGLYKFYGADTDASTLTAPKLTIDPSENLQAYQLVGLFSTTDGSPSKEPGYDYKLTLNFISAFKGELTDAAGSSVEKSFVQEQSFWEDTNDMFIKFDLENKKLRLYNSISEVQSVDLDDAEYTYLWNSFKDGSSYQAGDKFYVRFVLKDRSTGTETCLYDKMIGSANSSPVSSPVSLKYGPEIANGRVWSTKLDATNKSLSDILACKLWDNASYNWYDYDLLVYIGKDGSETIDGEKIATEPGTLDMLYTIHFDVNFPAANIDASTLKTVYKDALYTRANGSITPVLFKNYHEVLTDVTKTASAFSSKSYARWYLVYSDDASNDASIRGKVVTDLDSWGFSAGQTYTKKSKYGYYIENLGLNDTDAPTYDPTFVMPDNARWDTDDYKKYNVVCVVTTLTDDGELPLKEPSTMQVKYVYSLIMDATEYANQPFVHARGASGDAFSTDGATPHKQWIWDNGEKQLVAGDHRQQVHQWDYDIYLSPGEERALKLPFQWWDGSGEKLEPRGYFRWYDWDTDDMTAKYIDGTDDNGEFKTFGSLLHPITNNIDGTDYCRGYFAWNTHANPCQSNVGVKFKAPNSDNFDEITIVCDVSKYIDGLDPTATYLVHEPTLSTRYFFHIHPAKVIAKKIYDKGKALMDLNAGTTKYADLTSTQKLELFKTAEDNGRVVMSLNGTEGIFSLRFASHNMVNYFLDQSLGAGTDLANSSTSLWYAYYEDGNGNLLKMSLGAGSGRFKELKLSNFSGTYKNVDTGEDVSVTAAAGMKFHVVGSLKAYVNYGETYFPVVHDEMVFVDAAPIAIDATFPENRTEGYMTNPEHMTLGGRVDFDLFPEAERYTEPMNSEDNIMSHPVAWKEAQYGFCYPQLYDLNTASEFNGSAMHMQLSPIHGDYIIMKSANRENVSQRDIPTYTYQYHHWYGASELTDITNHKNSSQFGSFLYIDASDEARTIATFDFDGKLCSGSEVYFTAWVANFTEGTTPPQLKARVYGINGSEKQLLLSFLTGDIKTTGASAMGKWYQVYGHASMPEGVYADTYTKFQVQVDNYAPNTNGADYCVDEISVYTSTAQVMATQTSDVCGDDMSITITANAEKLLETIGAGKGNKNIYYRLFERFEDSELNPHHVKESEAVVGTNMYSDVAGSNPGYGVVVFDTNIDLSNVTATQESLGNGSGFFKDAEGKIQFQFTKRSFKLDPYKTYFVSVYSLTADHPGDTQNGTEYENGWGNPYAGHQCSVYSNDIVPFKMIIGMKDGEEEVDGKISIGCGGGNADKSFDLVLKYPDGKGGYVDYSGYKFDFFIGSKDNLKDVTGLNDAIKHMRAVYPETIISASGDIPVASGAFTTDDRTLIVDNFSKLKLSASTKFDYKFTTGGKLYFTALPIATELVLTHLTPSQIVDICSPLEFSFDVDANGGAPEIVLGFDDVDYNVPTAPTKRSIRIGLEQLAKLRRTTDTYRLHIPVNSYHDKDQGNSRKLIFGDCWLLVSETNDPTVAVNKKFAKVVPSDGSAETYLNKNYMYLTLDFSDSECDVDFHEGYYYEVMTRFYDENEKGKAEADRCYGEVYMIFKIVPEFVTWESFEIGATGLYNVNWNNDDNWKRSQRAELYKGTASGPQNTATDGHTKGYQNNVEMDSRLTSNPGYIPMKFTYVTMPTGNHAPDLNEITYETTGSVQTGDYQILLANTLITYTSPLGDGTISSYPTDGIHYDMLVRYGDHTEGGEGCFGHRYLDGDGDWADGLTTGLPEKVFDCEKFDGNICREIYFKPGAELLQQQRLKYEKAWVEKELVANKWYLMSSPLKGTYAGDMYVPMAMTDVSDGSQTKGRQVTEAFQPITFTDVYSASNPTGLYSRTKYPIYQRSWGITTSKVYTTTDDVRKTDYSAYLKWGGLSTTTAEWSHTYNDVQVPYNTIGGFSIRAHKKDQKDGSDNDIPALIRLPKNDASYDYYQYNSETASSGGINQTVVKSSSEIGKFVFDKSSTDLDKVEFSLDDLQAQGTDGSGNTYYLIGNPFMGSIDMGGFFAQNTAFGGVYYTYENGTLTTVDATVAPSTTSKHIIKPLQAFFVKCAGSAPANVVFDRHMMTDGNYEVGTAYANSANPARPRLVMRASNGEVSSTATIELSEKASAEYVGAEDVETLFDSNLSDVPMVFTVAGKQAVSIDQRPEIDVVSFGVSCAESNDLVEVTVDDSELALSDGQLYVVDAVTGDVTAVGEGSSVMVQPNDYGRYFLTTRGDLTAVTGIEADGGIVVSVRGSLVTVKAGEALTSVRALTTGGATVYSEADCGPEMSFRLNQGGVYIIEAQTAEARKTVKIVVKN